MSDLVVGDLDAGMGHVKGNASMKKREEKKEREKRKQDETMRPDNTILRLDGNCYVTGPVHSLSLGLPVPSATSPL